MKKILIVACLMYFGLAANSQKKNGTVFNSHPNIETTKKLWAAAAQGDVKAYSDLLNDSMIVIYNGSRDFQKREAHLRGITFWSKNFDNFKIEDDKPAFPDAIEYKEGGAWVQDWLRFSGIHKKTGIRLDLPVHCLYSFDDDGKITSLHLYFNNDVFQDISKSQTTRENGKVFINHPYITVVRKLVNAYCDENIDKMLTYYNPKVQFSDASMNWGDSKDLETQKGTWKENFELLENINMKQVGYPDCIYYEENNGYTVYSWWIHSATVDGNKKEFPIMLSHSFDDDGKIIRSMAYFSTNHIE